MDLLNIIQSIISILVGGFFIVGSIFAHACMPDFRLLVSLGEEKIMLISIYAIGFIGCILIYQGLT